MGGARSMDDSREGGLHKRIRETPPVNSHFSHLEASPSAVLPRASSPFSHSSVAACPKDFTFSNSDLSSLVSAAQYSFETVAFERATGSFNAGLGTTFRSAVRNTVDKAGRRIDGKEEERSRSTSWATCQHPTARPLCSHPTYLQSFPRQAVCTTDVEKREDRRYALGAWAQMPWIIEWPVAWQVTRAAELTSSGASQSPHVELSSPSHGGRHPRPKQSPRGLPNHVWLQTRKPRGIWRRRDRGEICRGSGVKKLAKQFVDGEQTPKRLGVEKPEQVVPYLGRKLPSPVFEICGARFLGQPQITRVQVYSLAAVFVASFGLC